MINWLGLLFDAGLAVLLVITIGYCARLSGRIRLLQDSRSELAGMIAQFDQATGRAMTSLAELQSVSKRVSDALQLKIEKANFLADDLAFLIEKSAKLAAQLEPKKPLPPEAPVPRPQPLAQALPESPPFLEVLPPAKSRSAAYASDVSDAEDQARSNASLEALLSRLSSVGTASSAATRPGAVKPPAPAARTEAERELYEALKGR